jgi:hypothetical protein
MAYSIVSSASMKALLHRTIGDRQKKGRGETFFFFHRRANDMCWGNNDELKEQMKLWRKQKKEIGLIMREFNNKTFKIKGQEWHILVVQSPTEDLGIDKIGFGFDDEQFLVSGYIYVFKSKANRDATYKYVMGVK